MKQLSICICLLFCLTSKAQVNLVPNYSFEDTVGQCQIQMGLSSLFSSVQKWYTCYYGSTVDYYNTCANGLTYPIASTVPYSCRTYQQPQHGNAFVGLWIYEVINGTDSSAIYSEDIAVKLDIALKANTCYYTSFYVNLGNCSNITTNQIGMLFTQNTFTTASGSFTNSIQPQVQWDTTKYITDTLNWVKVSGKFIAQGGEQYLTIGNFRDGTHLKKESVNTNFVAGGCVIVSNPRTYLLIDNITLYELPTPHLPSNNYIICPKSDRLVLGDTARIQTRYQWYANGTAIDTTSFIKIKPSASAGSATYTYILKSTNCTTTTQTIVVTYSANCEPVVIVEPTIPNVFTPNGDGVNDVWQFTLPTSCTLSGVEVYDRWGIEVLNDKLEIKNVITWSGRTTSGSECSSGVYFYVLEYTDANGDIHKKNGYVSLIR